MLYLVFLFFLVISAAFNPVAAKASDSGIDTTGVDHLPLAVEGTEGMRLVLQPSTGLIDVGIGTTTPSAPLDVNGGMRGSGTSVTVGSACSPEGMLGYDLSAHSPVYCDGAKWQSSQSKVLSFYGVQNSTGYNTFPITTIFSNTLLSSNPTRSSINVPSTGVYQISVIANVCSPGEGNPEAIIYANGNFIVGTDGAYDACSSANSTTALYLAAGSNVSGVCLENSGRDFYCFMSIVKLP